MTPLQIINYVHTNSPKIPSLYDEQKYVSLLETYGKCIMDIPKVNLLSYLMLELL
jgi:hypothetical protein